jgi:hypothetical protein
MDTAHDKTPDLITARPYRRFSPGGSQHRLGPLMRFVPMCRPRRGRLYAAAVFGAAVAVLGVAVALPPNPEGVGTHRALGLPPCGFYLSTGYPCPTCGMTTAYAHAVRGHFLDSARAQPVGLLLALLTAWGGLTAGYAAFSGRAPEVNWYRIHPTSLVWWCGMAVVAGWAVKIALGFVDGTIRRP